MNSEPKIIGRLIDDEHMMVIATIHIDGEIKMSSAIQSFDSDGRLVWTDWQPVTDIANLEAEAVNAILTANAMLCINGAT